MFRFLHFTKSFSFCYFTRLQRSYYYWGKEYHLVGSTVIALTLKSGDGSGKSRPRGQSLSRTWTNKKSSLQIKPSGLFASHSVSIFILQTEALKASCLFQVFKNFNLVMLMRRTHVVEPVLGSSWLNRRAHSLEHRSCI